MAALLDHLTAILVGGSLLVVLLFVQQRSKQSAVEASVRHSTEAFSDAFMSTLERDIENMREVNNYRPRLWRDGSNTGRFTFYTLADPSLGAASPVIAVTYRLEDTYQTMPVNGTDRPIYRVARYVNDATGTYTYAGGSTEGVLDFDISFLDRDGSTRTSGAASDDQNLIRIEVTSALTGPAAVAGDQAATTRTNVAQQGHTYRPLALALGDDAPAPPGVVPNPGSALPSSPYTPPADPDGDPDGAGTGSSPSGGSTGGSSSSSGGGSTGGSTGGSSSGSGGGDDRPTVPPGGPEI